MAGEERPDPSGGREALEAARPFRRILVPLDGSSFGESALPHARVLARLFASDVHLLSVLDPELTGATSATSAEVRLQRVEAEEYLAGAAARLRSSGLEVETAVRTGAPAQEIVEHAGEVEADLVVLAARPRREDDRLVSREVAQSVIAAGVVSVLVARGRDASRLPALWREAHYRSLLVPVDGSGPSHRALALAATVAREEEAELTLVHVQPEDRGEGAADGPGDAEGRTSTAEDTGSGERYLDRVCGAVEAKGVAAVQGRLFSSSRVPRTVRGVLQRTEPDLLVLAAHGAGEADSPYGHCALWLLRHSESPVLVLQDRPAATESTRSHRSSARRGRSPRRGEPVAPAPGWDPS